MGNAGIKYKITMYLVKKVDVRSKQSRLYLRMKNAIALWQSCDREREKT